MDFLSNTTAIVLNREADHHAIANAQAAQVVRSWCPNDADLMLDALGLS